MKRIRCCALFCFLFLSVGRIALTVSAADSQSATKSVAPGAEVATAISTVTGVAISPLLGAGAVGAYRYVNAPEAERAKLPWFAQPWFFLPALAIVLVCALKDVFGLAVPTALKKPFDLLETVEHKVSGLIVAGAFVPLISSVFHNAGTSAPASLGAGAMAHGHGFLAAMDFSWLLNLLTYPIALAAFVVVFLASNAINILILLSPFATVDAALKSFRLFILSSVTISSFANPTAGAIWALVIIFLAWFIAGWSFRLSHLGMMYVWEMLTFSRSRFKPAPNENWMFLGRAVDKTPTRTYGQLIRDAQGAFTFKYRPWMFLAQRSLAIPAGQYVVGRGLLNSEIERMEDGSARLVFLLPPRYRGHEEELSVAMNLGGVRPAGLRAAFAWLKERLGFGDRPALAQQPIQQY